MRRGKSADWLTLSLQYLEQIIQIVKLAQLFLVGLLVRISLRVLRCHCTFPNSLTMARRARDFSARVFDFARAGVELQYKSSTKFLLVVPVTCSAGQIQSAVSSSHFDDSSVTMKSWRASPAHRWNGWNCRDYILKYIKIKKLNE